MHWYPHLFLHIPLQVIPPNPIHLLQEDHSLGVCSGLNALLTVSGLLPLNVIWVISSSAMAAPLPNGVFVIGSEYSPIPGKLESKIRMEHWIVCVHWICLSKT